MKIEQQQQQKEVNKLISHHELQAFVWEMSFLLPFILETGASAYFVICVWGQLMFSE